MGAKGVGTNVDRQDIMGILYRHEPRDRDSLTQVAGMILRQKACIACLFICLSQEPVIALRKGDQKLNFFCTSQTGLSS